MALTWQRHGTRLVWLFPPNAGPVIVLAPAVRAACQGHRPGTGPTRALPECGWHPTAAPLPSMRRPSAPLASGPDLAPAPPGTHHARFLPEHGRQPAAAPVTVHAPAIRPPASGTGPARPCAAIVARRRPRDRPCAGHPRPRQWPRHMPRNMAAISRHRRAGAAILFCLPPPGRVKGGKSRKKQENGGKSADLWRFFGGLSGATRPIPAGGLAQRSGTLEIFGGFFGSVPRYFPVFQVVAREPPNRAKTRKPLKIKGRNLRFGPESGCGSRI